jgi:Dullard-like phosphatase family protein
MTDLGPGSVRRPVRPFLSFFSKKAPAYQPPPRRHGKKALVLDLDETLVHSAPFPPHSKIDYFKSGDPEFYVFKRPGLDAFLRIAYGVFETFIFTYGDRGYAEPILDRICPFIDHEHRLYRDLCSLEGGGVHKDLDIFQRPEAELILVDDSRATLQFHPGNTILIQKWTGTPLDRALIDWLPPILQKCVAVDDVRTVIQRIPRIQRAASEYARI